MNSPADNRDAMIEMVRQVQNASACVVDFDGMMNRLETQLGASDIGQLIFDPPDGKTLSAEEIVDQILARKKSHRRNESPGDVED